MTTASRGGRHGSAFGGRRSSIEKLLSKLKFVVFNNSSSFENARLKLVASLADYSTVLCSERIKQLARSTVIITLLIGTSQI